VAKRSFGRPRRFDVMSIFYKPRKRKSVSVQPGGKGLQSNPGGSVADIYPLIGERLRIHTYHSPNLVGCGCTACYTAYARQRVGLPPTFGVHHA